MQMVPGTPAPALRPLIRHYHGYHERDAAPGRHRGLPSPYLTVIVTLDDPLTVAAHPDPAQTPGRYDTLVGGLHTSPALITHEGRQAGVQIALSPLGARALFGLPAGALGNLDVDASALLGRTAHELHDRLNSAPGWAARFRVLDELLLRHADLGRAVPREVTRAWRSLLSTGGGVPVADLARETGWSTRHLSARFATETGLTPKAAARVIRFDRARRELQRRAGTGRPVLADLAAEFGYYDQAHLAREFRDLAGCPPSRWLAEEFRNVQAAATPSGETR
ncbi:AraC family transcriptional regulator [Sphaerisporangium melleum]|uniref:AraC family transcriptional regulator n=1 Tax=Sphaerisporangium melleum TaxID=321316 RepID=A0A917QR30_9ACTN|nr:helix-turn-helix domain-containing protein [Sphaerisporangium melleum]GGK62977.1 AraC family transcriptional regulator [Sphaerisporangium melleum]GII68034.1 AraC family transcriptional regulator [Sphaerisporangium melleum]